jgi:hypothetical protein
MFDPQDSMRDQLSYIKEQQSYLVTKFECLLYEL